MTTIVNTPGGNDSGSGGMVIIIVLLLLVVAGGVYWFTMGGSRNAPAAPTINVTLPTPSAPAAQPAP